jgi:hypothetical protein
MAISIMVPFFIPSPSLMDLSNVFASYSRLMKFNRCIGKLLINIFAFSYISSAVQISSIGVNKFNHSWDYFQKDSQRILSPKVTFPNVSFRKCRNAVRENGEYKRREEDPPKGTSPPQPKDVDEAFVLVASSCNTPSRKDCCTFSTLAMSSQHVNPPFPTAK